MSTMKEGKTLAQEMRELAIFRSTPLGFLEQQVSLREELLVQIREAAENREFKISYDKKFSFFKEEDIFGEIAEDALANIFLSILMSRLEGCGFNIEAKCKKSSLVYPMERIVVDFEATIKW